MQYNSAAKLPTWAESTSDGSMSQCCSAPCTPSFMRAEKCLFSLVQLREKSVW